MIETATSPRQRKAFAAAHAARGEAVRSGLRWVAQHVHMPLRFRALTASSR